MNPFFQGNQQPQGPFAMLQSMRGQIASNPFSFIAKSKFNVPSNVGNDANSIVQYLLTTGQITQEQVNWAMQKAREIQQ